MKKLLLITLLCLLVQQTAFPQSFSTNNKKGWELCSERKSQMKLLPAKSANSPKHSFDVLNYSLSLDLMACYTSPYPTSFKATNVMRFRVDSALNQIQLNASGYSLQIDSVKLSGAKLTFSHQNDLLTITLDRTYDPQEEVEITIYYNRKNVRDDSFYVEQGWLYTDCEPEGARQWFPCWDKPSDKATADITAKVPKNVKLGATGHLQDSINDGTSITYKWVSRDPVATYLVVIASKANYNLDIVNWTNPRTQEVVPIRFYYNNGENISYPKSIIGDMTTFFSDYYGDHPFEKNGFATVGPSFTWGGMENQTLTTLCRNCWQESLIAHEYAHQWFGDMVTCATWADIWLNEGFATWSEAFWNGHRNGYSYYLNEIKQNASSYKYSNPGTPISNPAWAVNTPGPDVLFNTATTYNKSSCVVHQLRYVLGDSLFFKCLKAYATDTVNFKYKSATTEDFKNKFEEVSGQQLDWFFDSWIYQPNHPTYKNEYWMTDLGAGMWRFNFFAKQINNVFQPYWQMPLEVKISFADQSDTIVRFFNSVNSESFHFDFHKQPVSAVFDPNSGIVLRDGTTILSTNQSPVAFATGISSVSPNPFSESTTVTYTLSKKAHVKLSLYNLQGKLVQALVDADQQTGDHSVVISGQSLTAGVYFCRFSDGEASQTVKVVILK